MRGGDDDVRKSSTECEECEEKENVIYEDGPFASDDNGLILVEDFLPPPEYFVMKNQDGNSVHKSSREWTEKDYEAALKQIEELMDIAEPDSPEEDMLDALATLVKEYEDREYPIEFKRSLGSIFADLGLEGADELYRLSMYYIRQLRLARSGGMRIPTNREPTHPGVILQEEFLEPMEISIQQLADDIGMDINWIEELINKKMSMTPGVAMDLSKRFGMSAEYWINSQVCWDVYHERTNQ